MKVNQNALRGCRYLVAAVVAMGLAINESRGATTYPDISVSGPTSSFPVSFKAFNPPVDAAVAAPASAPEIYEYSRDNNAGDTMVLTGGNFSPGAASEYVDSTEVSAVRFQNTSDSIRHGGFSWNSGTVIEVRAGAFATPVNEDRLFNLGGACIYYSGGRWYASNGSGGGVNLGSFDAGIHTFRFENGSASLDGNAVSVGSVNRSGDLWLGCDSPSYRDFPLRLEGYRIWQSGSLVVDAVPQVDGTFRNLVDGSIIRNNEQDAGQPRPFVTEASRSLSGTQSQPTFFVAFGEGVLDYCDIARISENEAAVTLPSGLPADDVYMVWPGNSAGIGAPVVVNRTEAWWVSERVLAGGQFTVFGRNLGPDCQVYIQELGQWLTNDSANPYKAVFTLPAGVANGSYTVWAHNSKGRAYGWAEQAMTINVVSPVQYNGRTINVANYGATGNGSTDDWGAVSSAFAASSAGDTVYFPAGTYRLGGVITGRSGIRIAGAGMNATTIKPTGSHSNNGILIDGSFNNVTFADLTIETTSGANKTLFRMRGSNNRFENARLSSLEWTGYKETPFTFDASEHLTFSNCEVINSSNPGNLSVSGARQVFFDGCTFRGANECSQIIGSWGGEEISVQNCVARPYDSSSTGYFDGRWFVVQDYWGGVNRVYFGDNTSQDIAPPKGIGYHENTGEQVLIEGGIVRTRGNVVSATPTTVRIPDVSKIFNSKHVVTITDGKGYGQSRKVVSVDAASNTITLAEPWRVVPDSSSVFVVSSAAYRFAVYNNNLDGRAEWTSGSTHSASTGVEVYGGTIDIIVDQNTLTELRTGIVHWSLAGIPNPEYPRSLQTCNFNVFKNNTLQNCYNGILNSVAESGDAILDGGIMGATYRDNAVGPITRSGLIFSGSAFDEYLIKVGVYERNTFRNLETAISLDTFVKNQVFIDNVVDGVQTVLETAYNSAPVLRGNSFSNYGTLHQNGPSVNYPVGPVISTPRPYTVATEASGAIELWNTGTASLNNLSATSSAGWLSVDSVSGSIAGQGANGQVVYSINTATAPTSDAIATIAVSSGQQTQQITVHYDADSILEPPPPPDPPPSAVLSSIRISGDTRVDEGGEVQLTCTAFFTDGSSAVVTPDWIDNSTYASVSASGLLSAGDVDSDVTVTVTATLEGFSDTHAVTIEFVPLALTGIEIVGPSVVDEESTTQYSCLATYSDGSRVEVVPVWNDQSEFADVSSTGLLTTRNVLKDEIVSLEASYNGIGVSRTITVNYVVPLLDYLIISGPTSVLEYNSAQYSCMAYYSDGTSAAVDPAWAEGSPFAEISTDGLLSVSELSSDQNATIQASFGGRSSTLEVVLTDVPAVLLGIRVEGPTEVEEEQSVQYSCVAVYSDGSTQVVRPSWTNASEYAAIDQTSGLMSVGRVPDDVEETVIASYDGFVDTHVVNLKITGSFVRFPLSGYENRLVRAELYDRAADEYTDLGEFFQPEELLVRDMQAGQWYWLLVEVYDEVAGVWVEDHASWISM